MWHMPDGSWNLRQDNVVRTSDENREGRKEEDIEPAEKTSDESDADS